MAPGPLTINPLTSHLLNLAPSKFKDATQSKFLQLAASGELDTVTLGTWLAHDRLYIRHYIQGAGRLLELAVNETPRKMEDPQAAAQDPSTQLVDWIIESLVNIRREEQFFIKTAVEYGFSVNVEDYPTNLPGLGQFESIFCGISAGPQPLTWLEGAVIFWATEKCYLEAWSWAKAQGEKRLGLKTNEDLDGGAVRKEFIPNWTSHEFRIFVERLGSVINTAVQSAIKALPSAEEDIMHRAEAKWLEVLAAETDFWPRIP